MAADVNDLDKRISILETEFENMDNTITKMETTVSENYESTLAIKERLDKWNGSIPHLVEDVKVANGKMDKVLEALSANTVADAKNSVKIKVMWAILAAAASSLLTLAIKLLVP